MTDLMQGIDGFGLQMTVWGYALQGDLCDFTALVAEGKSQVYLLGEAWDRTAADIATHMVSHDGEPYRPVKYFAALPWVTEHILRKHEEWPGL